VVEKLITNRMYQQLVENFDRIALHNWLFPETAMVVVGFGRTKALWNPDDTRGQFVIHVRQPLIQISGSATEEEIAERMVGMGFVDGGGGRWTSGDGSVVVDDLHEENAVVDGTGRFCVVDADIRLNTPRLGMGGKYVIPPMG